MDPLQEKTLLDSLIAKIDFSKVLFGPEGSMIIGRSAAPPLHRNSAGDPVCECGAVHGTAVARERLRLIGRIVVQTRLPAGDPCWMASMVGRFVEVLPAAWEKCELCTKVGCASCIRKMSMGDDGGHFYCERCYGC